MKDRMDSAEIAQELYAKYVTATGFTRPETTGDLLLFVELSGGVAVCCGDSPPSFEGIQIGRWIYIRHPDGTDDRARMRVLAHEWCHWLRRPDHGDDVARAYRGSPSRDVEEGIARAFERLF